MTPAQYEYIHKGFVRELKSRDMQTPSSKETKMAIALLGLHIHDDAQHTLERLIESYLEMLGNDEGEDVRD